MPPAVQIEIDPKVPGSSDDRVLASVANGDINLAIPRHSISSLASHRPGIGAFKRLAARPRQVTAGSANPNRR